MTARKKIYHALDFGVALPDTLDLEYAKSLSTKDRLKYLSDPDILPQKGVGEYMKKLGQHLLDPSTDLIVGTLGGNGGMRGFQERMDSILVREMMYFSPMRVLNFTQV